MEYYERERIINICRQNLPYPISFYDRLSDGSLWNVYNKHVVQGIPINKRKKKAKAQNDLDRQQEAQMKAEKAKITPVKAEPVYEQLTLDLLYDEPKHPAICQDDQGVWWRRTDSGEYDMIPDSELQDVIDIFGGSYTESIKQAPKETGRQLTLRRTYTPGK